MADYKLSPNYEFECKFLSEDQYDLVDNSGSPTDFEEGEASYKFVFIIEDVGKFHEFLPVLAGGVTKQQIEETLLQELESILPTVLSKSSPIDQGRRIDMLWGMPRFKRGSIILEITASIGFTATGIFYFFQKYKDIREGFLQFKEDSDPLRKRLFEFSVEMAENLKPAIKKAYERFDMEYKIGLMKIAQDSRKYPLSSWTSEVDEAPSSKNDGVDDEKPS